MEADKIKDLNYYRENAEEDYGKVPISVLRYISELEQEIKTMKEKEGKFAEWAAYYYVYKFRSTWINKDSGNKKNTFELKEIFNKTN